MTFLLYACHLASINAGLRVAVWCMRVLWHTAKNADSHHVCAGVTQEPRAELKPDVKVRRLPSYLASASVLPSQRGL